MTLPAGWTSATLGDICYPSQYGWTARASTDGKVRFLRTTDISSGRIDWGSVPFAESIPDDAERYALRANDIVISRAGSIGLSALIGDCPPSFFASYLIRFRPYESMAPRYVAFYLQCPQYWNQVRESAAGIALQNINATKLSRFVVPVAPRPEQDRIVAEIEKQFTRLDDAVAALKRVQANLKRYRASVLKAACEGRLVPTEAELARKEGRRYEPASELLKRILVERRAKWEADQLAKMMAASKPPKNDDWKKKYKEAVTPETTGLPQLPAGWTWAALEQVVSVFVDSAHRTPTYGEVGVPAIGPRDVVAGVLNAHDTRLVSESEFKIQTARRIPQPGDILYSRELSYGWAALVPSSIRLCLSQGMCLFRPHDLISAEYLRVVLNGPIGRAQASKAATGSAHPHINISDIRAYSVPLPPTEEQLRIITEVEARLSVVEHSSADIEAKLGASTRLRQCILRHAFDGKLVRQDPADEPSSALLGRIRAERAMGTSTRTAKRTPRKRSHATVASEVR